MPKRKFKLTRLELKHQRDQLERFERYLPTLKLKQQQLQLTLLEVAAERKGVQAELDKAEAKFAPYRAVLADLAGLNVRELAEPEEIKTAAKNVAGVNVPVFEDATFPEAAYSLFATPPWVDQALADLRDMSLQQARLDVLQQQYDLLRRELTKIMQRVNLFEKVRIPQAREAIRVIRIHLGDAQTAAVARAKIAKAKLAETERTTYEGWRGEPAGDNQA